MSRYYWPSWCQHHHRPHIRQRKCCLTNRDRRILRRMIAEVRRGDVEIPTRRQS